jgi:hypothetical protein
MALREDLINESRQAENNKINSRGWIWITNTKWANIQEVYLNIINTDFYYLKSRVTSANRAGERIINSS